MALLVHASVPTLPPRPAQTSIQAPGKEVSKGKPGSLNMYVFDYTNSYELSYLDVCCNIKGCDQEEAEESPFKVKGTKTSARVGSRTADSFYISQSILPEPIPMFSPDTSRCSHTFTTCDHLNSARPAGDQDCIRAAVALHQ
ncbi:hypothetical protein CBL_11225 [Carabus blaptoides fortunei]